MIHLAPFESLMEHREYCACVRVPFEDGAVGFKIFNEEEKLGLCQIKFVGEAAYILSLAKIDDKISVQMLANIFTSVLEFLQRVGSSSVIFPIQSQDDVTVAQACGFDQISETLFVFDFPSEENPEEDVCNCDHDHPHHQF